jgi:hypothetical protein
MDGQRRIYDIIPPLGPRVRSLSERGQRDVVYAFEKLYLEAEHEHFCLLAN